MKKALILLMLCSLVFVAGCSKSSADFAWAPGSITSPRGEMSVDTFIGYGATAELNGLPVEYYMCDSRDECSHNTIGVMPENMTEYKKAYYYVGYLGTQLWMFYKNDGNGWVEAHVNIPDRFELTTDQIVELLYKKMQTIVLSDDIAEIQVCEGVVLNSNMYDFIIRKHEVVIPSMLRVKADDGSMTFENSTMIGDKTLGLHESEKYIYYSYNGMVFQTPKGFDLTSYVTFK